MNALLAKLEEKRNRMPKGRPKVVGAKVSPKKHSCEICGIANTDHLQCEGCLASTCYVFCSLFRGYNLCGHCIKRWHHLESKAHRDISWQEFKEGDK